MRLRRGLEDDIKKILSSLDGVGWIHLAHDIIHWRAVVTRKWTLRFRKGGIFLDQLGNDLFLKMFA